MVRWMSGLVTGLQNRLQRFESASDLILLRNTFVNQAFTKVFLFLHTDLHTRQDRNPFERRNTQAVARLYDGLYFTK